MNPWVVNIPANGEGLDCCRCPIVAHPRISVQKCSHFFCIVVATIMKTIFARVFFLFHFIKKQNSYLAPLFLFFIFTIRCMFKSLCNLV